jgi:parallel beta-helix repeat protein
MTHKAMRILKILVLGMWLSLVLSPISIGQARLRVPQEFATIEKAINAAKDGDIIVVSEGIYQENLFIRKSITLRASGRAEIVSKDTFFLFLPPVITIEDASGVVIEGFIIREGGAGIFISRGASALIRRNIIIQNGDGIHLGGVVVGGVGYSIASTAATIEGNVISGNKNGIWIQEGSAEISHNSIINNLQCDVAVEEGVFIGGSWNKLSGNDRDLCGTPEGGWPQQFWWSLSSLGVTPLEAEVRAGETAVFTLRGSPPPFCCDHALGLSVERIEPQPPSAEIEFEPLPLLGGIAGITEVKLKVKIDAPGTYQITIKGTSGIPRDVVRQVVQLIVK